VLLYDNPVSGNCYKVRLLLAHLGAAYERHTVDVVDRSNRRELLAALNPALRVPTLVLDDGRALAESNAILWYFGEGTRFVPDDRYERAQALQWMFFEQYEHEPAIAVLRFALTYSGKPELFEPRREERTRAGYRALEAMEGHLAGRQWLVGESMTIAAPFWPAGSSAPWRSVVRTCADGLSSVAALAAQTPKPDVATRAPAAARRVMRFMVCSLGGCEIR
jgi:glutathione S-transferase